MKSTIKGSTRTVDKRFKFDHIFDSSASQEDVFRGVRMPQMLEGVLDGYHATVFAYGQTASGKTFTIHGGLGGAGLDHPPVATCVASPADRTQAPKRRQACCAWPPTRS